LSYANLAAFCNTKYPDYSPWYPSSFTYHNKHVNKLSSEELIKQAAEKGEIIADTVFTQKENIGSADSYLKLIAEYWTNYTKIRDKPGNDLSKRNYLDSISKHLELLSRQKVLEKDYLTQLNILKEKREQDTPAQRLDYIQGWGIPSLLEKTNSEDEARLYLSKLLEFVSNLDLALASGKNRFVVAKEGMEWLYDKQKGVIY